VLFCQVSIPQAGNVTFGGGVQLQCPTASNFLDDLDGLYGSDGAYLVYSEYCRSNDPTVDQVLVSSLEFTCAPCPNGTYSVFAGSSNGTPKQKINFPCLPCPHGGTCLSGVPIAVSGYWGAANHGVVSFALCPSGYCNGGPAASGNDGGAAGSACAGHRRGVLCGDCDSGYVEGIGSAQCAPVSACGHDKPRMWAAIGAGLVVSGLLQLTLVSGVWLLKRDTGSFPSAKLKLALYFFQVRRRLRTVGCETLQTGRCTAIKMSVLPGSWVSWVAKLFTWWLSV
jgi:hypothetical protein